MALVSTRLRNVFVYMVIVSAFIFGLLEFNFNFTRTRNFYVISNDINFEATHATLPPIPQGEKVKLDRYCGCRVVKSGPYESTCSDTADFRGPDQRVISYSFYGGSLNTDYFNGIRGNLADVESYYPGYVMRLYTDVSPGQDGHSYLCGLFCHTGSILDVCPVQNLGHNMSTEFGMLWRFAPMADPLVGEWHSRDLDSRPSQREVDAVNDWLPSGKTYHIMRDNPVHNTKILGGAFGMQFIKDNKDKDRRSLAKSLFLNMLAGSRATKGYDQTVLKKHVWPHAEHDSVAHDSYLCLYNNPRVGNRDSAHRAFPTQRVNSKGYGEPHATNFVGSNGGKIFLPHSKQCPPECRPVDHQDWLLC